MPTIDVTGVLASLGIANQVFSVVQRRETLDHGRTVLATDVVSGVMGAVQPLGDNSLLREEQYTTGNNGITVWTKFRLNSAARAVDGTTYQPDLIFWQEAYYLVRVLDQWTDFGAGYVKAECMMTNFAPPVTT